MKYKKEIKQFRQKISIGIQDALANLEKYDGHIDKALFYYKNKLINKLMHLTSINHEQAEKLLAKFDYHLESACSYIEYERLSDTEKVLQRNDSIQNKFYDISFLLENVHELNMDIILIYDYDTLLQKINRLNKPRKIIMKLSMWLELECDEGFSDIFNLSLTEDVITSIREELLFRQLADNLIDRKISLKKKGIILKNNLDSLYTKAISYISKNIDDFP